MRKALGFVVLVLGVGALGWWARGHDALRMQQFVTDRAAEVVAGSVHGATTTVSGRDIHLSGLLNGADEQTSLIAALEALPGRRVVTSDATVLETASPYTMDVVKAETLTTKGFVPTEKARAALAARLGEAATGLTLAAGAPDGWDAMVTAGLAALGPLNKGMMSLSGTTLKVSGEALGPQEEAAVDAALAGLPAGTFTKEITLLDDGTPAAYNLDFSAINGASISGKLPKGLDISSIATAMGLGSIAGTVKQAVLGDAVDPGLFSGLKGVLGKLESLNMTFSPEMNMVKATVQPNVDAAAVKAALVDGLAGFNVSADNVSVDLAASQAENGATRVNAATGANQRFMGNYWLDLPNIQVGAADCQASVDRVLSDGTVNFVTGSDELGDGAINVINALGAVMIQCAEQGKLRAVIGGHTDSTGDAQENLGLSQRRAVAVRRELIALGVAPEALKSIGYGAQFPIADEATDEGKAMNRRTTIVWAE